MPTPQHPHGFIISDAEDLLHLFDADCGVLVIGDGAKVLGVAEQGREMLAIAQYLRAKGFKYGDLLMIGDNKRSS